MRALNFALFLAAAAIPAQAQNDPSTRGLGIAVRGGVAGVQRPDRPEPVWEPARAAGVQLGYGFTSRFTVYLRAEEASVDYEELATGERYRLTQREVAIRFSAGALQSRWRPFAAVGLSRVEASDELAEVEYALRGTAGVLGAGVELFLAPDVSVELEVSGTAGTLTAGEFNGEPLEPDEPLRIRRFTTGLTWRP